MQRIVRVPQDGVPVTEARDVAADPSMGRKFSIKTDVVVVGSGAGGSVVAYEMAKAGKSVLVLESGKYYPSAEFTEHLGDTIHEVYRDQAGQANSTADVLFIEGNCVGGSTVIGACVMHRLNPGVWQDWADNHGLKDLAPDKIAPYTKIVDRWLNVHVNEAHEINATAHKVIQGCERMGFSWRPVERNVKKCALTGHCLAGCPSDRKMSALVTHLPWAAAYGARLFADTHVTRVLERGGRAVGVEAVIRDPKTGSIVSDLRVDAEVVVLAAGAIHTPLIMQRSQLADRSGRIGNGMAVQPFVQVLSTFKEPVYGFRGALTGVQVDEFQDTDGYFFISGLAEPEQLMAVGEQKAGDAHIEFMKSYNRMAGINAFSLDEGSGSVVWEGGLTDGRKVIKWNPSRKEFKDIVRTTALASRILFSAGAERVWLPTFEKMHADSVFDLDDKLRSVDYGINGLYTFRMNTFSPHGSARMGVDPYESVVSPDGEMHDVSGLYVADASLFPTPVAAGPQWATQVFAKYVSDRILARGSNHFLG
jgi:choline dehydrogenase-like flavoprotein